MSKLAVGMMAFLVSLSAFAASPDIYVAGGPFFIRGDGVVACVSAAAAMVVNDPDANRKYGRATTANAMSQGRCQDAPDGLRVLVLSVQGSLASAQPDYQSGAMPLIVPAAHIVNILGDPITSIPELKWPMVNYDKASHFGASHGR